MEAQVLFVCHGRTHDQLTYGYKPLEYNREIYYKYGTFIDMDPDTNPTIIMDLTTYDKTISHQLNKRFDFIFVMGAPPPLFYNRQFWQNMERWLAPYGSIMSILPPNTNTQELTRIVYSYVPFLNEKNAYDYVTPLDGIEFTLPCIAFQKVMKNHNNVN